MEPLTDFLALLKPLGEISATGLLVVVVVMILTGRLVPRSALNDWKNAYRESQEAHARKDQALSEMAEAATVSARALDSIPTNGGEPDDFSSTAEVRRRRRQG